MRGNMEFVGELYKRKVLSEKIVIGILRKLVETDPPDNTDIEAFSKLMTTAGAQFDTQKNSEAMQYIFGSKLPLLAVSDALTLRTRFMVRDLIDLRKDGWRLRRKREVAKTLDQVHREAVQEKQEKTRNSRSSGGRGSSGNRYANRPPQREVVPEIKKVPSSDEWTTSTRGKSSRQPKKWGEPKPITATKNTFGKLAVGSYKSNSVPQSPPIEEEEEEIESQEVLEEVEDSESEQKLKAENLTASTLEEYLGGDDLEEGIACVKEIIPGSCTDLQQQDFVGYVFGYCLKKNVRNLKPIYRLFEALLDQNVLSSANLATGFSFVIRGIDEVSEELPAAPERLGDIIGLLYNRFDNLEFLLGEADNVDSFNFSKLVSSLIGVLEGSDPNFDFTKAGLDAHILTHKVALLKKKLSPKSIEECCEWAVC